MDDDRTFDHYTNVSIQDIKAITDIDTIELDLDVELDK